MAQRRVYMQRRIFDLLSREELSTNQIASRVGISPKDVPKYCNELFKEGKLNKRKGEDDRGRTTFWSIKEVGR